MSRGMCILDHSSRDGLDGIVSIVGGRLTPIGDAEGLVDQWSSARRGPAVPDRA